MAWFCLFTKPSSRPREVKVRCQSQVVNRPGNQRQDQVPSVCHGNVAKTVEEGTKRLRMQIHSYTFDTSDSISAINVLFAVKLACNIDGIFQGASMWFFHFILSDSSAAAPMAHYGQKPSSLHTPKYMKRLLRKYP